MPAQSDATFGDALKRAIDAAGYSQAKLARALNIDPGQVSRWVRGRSQPLSETVTRIEECLEVDLRDAFIASAPAYELYISAPITGLSKELVAAHHDDVGRVVETLTHHVNSRYWPGEQITGTDKLLAADLSTEKNMRVLPHCAAYLYLQFSEVVRPSSALIELGIALGRKIKTTIIVKSSLNQPYMLKGFSAVAGRSVILPEARIYTVDDVDEACELVARNGRELLGLA